MHLETCLSLGSLLTPEIDHGPALYTEHDLDESEDDDQQELYCLPSSSHGRDGRHVTDMFCALLHALGTGIHQAALI